MPNRPPSKANRNRLSDRDMLLDLLVTEKYMSHLYDHAIMEAAGDTVRDTFVALQHDEHDTAQILFDFMHQHGWYTTGANRQKSGRRLQEGQPLSGGRPQKVAQGGPQQPRFDSSYAVASGTRRLGQNFGKNRGHGQGNRQPAWNGRNEQRYYEHNPEWDYQ
ncbi:spore coat protein [Anaeroselena agilis]|uniref:Spore coat protein n=1 Tax=Anaeroselena agilis TaxID=3063788 RepID=A0ABU3NYD4_9FIRM|nr:spore coat protein [Selenomonadales bacterium 4137-cl]